MSAKGFFAWLNYYRFDFSSQYSRIKNTKSQQLERVSNARKFPQKNDPHEVEQRVSLPLKSFPETQ